MRGPRTEATPAEIANDLDAQARTLVGTRGFDRLQASLLRGARTIRRLQQLLEEKEVG